MRGFCKRTEYVILAFAQMLYWIYDGCKLYSEEMAFCGNTLGCIWRWRMARVDWLVGKAPSAHVALHRRLNKTLWAKRRNRCQELEKKQRKKRFAHAEMKWDELRIAAECLADDYARGVEKAPHGWNLSTVDMEQSIG